MEEFKPESLTTAQELSPEEIVAAEAALALFTREHWDEPVPELDKSVLNTVRAYFASRGMVATANIWPVGLPEVSPFEDNQSSRPWTLRSILAMHQHSLAELENFSDAVVGPYILGDQYVREGAAVWRSEEYVKVSL